ncbi:MAG: hypothetical protein KME29_19035 [Calothrix sp. FI2-JRJ7]|nr:hypothetical protein [Calothrix sp. FI2-JRJ7]
MSDKKAVLELVKGLPPDISFRGIIKKIEFIAAVKDGIQEIDQGKGVSIEAVEQMIEGWTTK